MASCGKDLIQIRKNSICPENIVSYFDEETDWNPGKNQRQIPKVRKFFLEDKTDEGSMEAYWRKVANINQEIDIYSPGIC